jgi:hypothetical protein
LLRSYQAAIADCIAEFEKTTTAVAEIVKTLQRCQQIKLSPETAEAAASEIRDMNKLIVDGFTRGEGTFVRTFPGQMLELERKLRKLAEGGG